MSASYGTNTADKMSTLLEENSEKVTLEEKINEIQEKTAKDFRRLFSPSRMGIKSGDNRAGEIISSQNESFSDKNLKYVSYLQRMNSIHV